MEEATSMEEKEMKYRKDFTTSSDTVVWISGVYKKMWGPERTDEIQFKQEIALVIVFRVYRSRQMVEIEQQVWKQLWKYKWRMMVLVSGG